MQLTINSSDNVSNEKMARLMAEIERLFANNGLSCKIGKETTDPWDILDIDDIAVDTGIEDFAENHDHYLYGTEKRK